MSEPGNERPTVVCLHGFFGQPADFGFLSGAPFAGWVTADRGYATAPPEGRSGDCRERCQGY